jgi:hypothetical protein
LLRRIPALDQLWLPENEMTLTPRYRTREAYRSKTNACQWLRVIGQPSANAHNRTRSPFRSSEMEYRSFPAGVQ